MSKLTFKNETFSCHLTCGQCTFVKDDGQRCRNIVCIGTPTCWIHTKRLYGVKTRPSTIENAGKGLFAEKEFRNSEWICPYGGEIIDQACLDARYPGGDDVVAPYATEIPNNIQSDIFDDLIIDNIAGFVGPQYADAACVRGVGSMANGLFNRDGMSQSIRRHNAQIEDRPGQGLWIRARKDIQPGSEIFLHYGDAYFLEDNGEHITKRSRGVDNRPC